MAKTIMIQGTASSVGKSLVTAALCRIFMRDGYSAAPFKSQNMALNSFVTRDGLEIGRAQAMQADAAGIEPSVLMNPILLKPCSDKTSQVIINGRVFRNMDAAEYHAYKSSLRGIVKEAFADLSRQHEIIVIEGAGSPAEINLRENDIVNMGMAEMADAPVVLVADIDRGGVFASIAGTMLLLDGKERDRVKGVIINKFRGDIDILKPGIESIENITGKLVLGVLPYFRHSLEDEDSITGRFLKPGAAGDINICVIRLPHISNFSDFNVFDIFEDVSLAYADKPEDILNPDIIIIPGSKNTIGDLLHIGRNGIAKKILELHENGCPVIGICGGYQMLGESVADPSGAEGDICGAPGLGLLGMRTVIGVEKTTRQVEGKIISCSGILQSLEGSAVRGYEIHMGISSSSEGGSAFALTETGNDGTVSGDVIGTYIHGIFDSVEFTRGLLNNVRIRKGLSPFGNPPGFEGYRQNEFDRLAEMVRTHIDMNNIYKILNDNDRS